jgi:D-3-phosphoglycerate dehydrogenase
MDNIDEDYALEKGIKLINAPEGNMDAVGEHAIGLLLSLMNNINTADAEIRAGSWQREENRGYELKGKPLVLLATAIWAAALPKSYRVLG